MIPCPWHGGYHLSRAIVAVCKQQVEPSQRCSACRARARRQVAVDPRCGFHRRYPTLEQGDWWGARELDARIHRCPDPDRPPGCAECVCRTCGRIGLPRTCGHAARLAR